MTEQNEQPGYPQSAAEIRPMLDAMRLLRGYGYRVIPSEVYDDTLSVIQYVSRGRGYVDVTPYPDARARRVGGFLMTEDAGCPDDQRGLDLATCLSPQAAGRTDRCGRFTYPPSCLGDVCSMPDAQVGEQRG